MLLNASKCDLMKRNWLISTTQFTANSATVAGLDVNFNYAFHNDGDYIIRKLFFIVLICLFVFKESL